MFDPSLDIHSVLVNQEMVRNPHHLEDMIAFVKGGGHWTSDIVTDWARMNGGNSEPIYIARFPDGVQMIQDGHHRIVATFLAGRNFLLAAEYVTHDWTYDDYRTINLKRFYVTPHDPVAEVRVPDLGLFKRMVGAILKYSEDDAVDFINKHKYLYAHQRGIRTVSELSALVNTDGMRAKSGSRTTALGVLS